MRVLQALSFYFRNETFSHRASIEDVAQVRDAIEGQLAVPDSLSAVLTQIEWGKVMDSLEQDELSIFAQQIRQKLLDQVRHKPLSGYSGN